MDFADDYYGIPDALAANAPLRKRIVGLIQGEPIHGKAVAGPGRVGSLRVVLRALAEGSITHAEAYRHVQEELPRRTSVYVGDNRVFSRGWAERLVRTQFSRMYNTAVLQLVIERGGEFVDVPHSSREQRSSKCTRALAGREHVAEVLLDRIYRRYRHQDYSAGLTVPEHPHCTHVVRPTPEDSSSRA